MMEVKNIHKSFRDNHVLRNLNFSVPKGHITGLVGSNGCGKSTTIRIMTGFYNADKGQVSVDDQPMSINAVDAKRLVGYAPESAPAYREQTVCEYLYFIAQLRGVAKKETTSEVDRAIDAFSLQKVYRQAIGTLSKGYRHRVSLGQCLLGDPPVIILDEPTDGLDPIQKIETRNMIKELAQTKAVLLTTHLLEEVDLLCDRVVLLNQGHAAFTGTIEETRLAGTANTAVYVRVAPNDVTQLKKSADNIEGLLSAYIQETEGRLIFGLPSSSRDILDEVSRQLSEKGVRIIELRRDDPPLAGIFNTRL